MSVRTLLEQEIQGKIEALEKLEYGTEKYKSAVDSVTKLLDKLNDMDRMEHEYQDKFESREAENDLKLKQMSEDKKDRIIKNCLTAASLLVGTGVTIWGTKVSMKFEENGTFTTIMGRGFINKLLPKK